MSSNFRISSLAPCGLIVERVIQCEDTIKVAARSQAGAAACPSCGTISQRVHSRYVRQAADLPCSGRSVGLSLVARRYFCDAKNCQRRIFAERFDETILSALSARARRTTRLDCVVHHLGLALGGRPAASFARRLMLPVGNDTLLRVVRRRAGAGTEPLTVVGIDDWAFRRNHRFGINFIKTESEPKIAPLVRRASTLPARFGAGDLRGSSQRQAHAAGHLDCVGQGLHDSSNAGEQRCWVHKTANVPNKLPKSQHAKAKRALQAISMAETKAEAEAVFDAFIDLTRSSRSALQAVSLSPPMFLTASSTFWPSSRMPSATRSEIDVSCRAERAR